jgi:xylan 1,4-beta-xylosidase
MSVIRNPILPGFNPDPSICRVGPDYYIANSTFEWYPGVQIHHSRDLANWTLVSRPLTRATQLDMRGNPDSCGIWAPCLTYADGQFWLIYTDVKRFDGDAKDAHNYLVTAPSVEGPWSDPVYMNSSGFDPSLFHDDDGRKWFVNMVWDHRAGKNRFGGILLQEYSQNEQTLTGPVVNIYKGSPLGLVEGPHLYKKNGWYYLITAEGGTGYDHAITIARSRTIDGPYETHPQDHLLTSRFDPSAPLQRSGHGGLVETEAGETYAVHLCGRPIPGPKQCPMGRETAIQPVVWGEDGWPRLAHGGLVPALEIPAPKGLTPAPVAADPVRFDFDGADLPMPFQWLRTPHPERLFSLTAKPGSLRLYGRESMGSWYEQSLIALRQTTTRCRAETVVDAKPVNFQQLAGLIAYYNRYKFHYLAVTATDEGQRALTIVSCNGDYPDGAYTEALPAPVPLPAEGPVRMALDIDGVALRFRYAIGDGPWTSIGPALDAGVLSDEGGRGEHGSFTGNFIGMAAHDISGQAMTADFDHFEYENL